VRATLLAQQDKHSAAIAELDRAVELGWRRAWLTARDPAFAQLRNDPAFARALARMRP
jgi:hypothetical protein